MNWFALAVKPHHDQKVATHLFHKGYEMFVPVYRSRRFWSDRVKELDLPLFPGYVFCRFDSDRNLGPVVTTPGVVHILGSGSHPEPIDEAEIKAIQTIVASRLQSGPWPYMREGCRVAIRRGPLVGLEGLVITVKSSTQLIVSVSLLSRSIAVALDPAWLSVTHEPAVTSGGADRAASSTYVPLVMTNIQRHSAAK